jgi:hypothetical protein
MDDDGLPGGDSHHYQLARAFRNIGAHLPLADEEFGSPEALSRYLDQETAHFVQLAQRLYSHSLGLSVDWMRALAEALSVHFPQFVHEPYFEDCFSQRVEERHAEEALTITQMVLRQRPELLDETIRDAKMMTEVLSIIIALSSTRETSRHPLGGRGYGLAALSFKNARDNRHPSRPAGDAVGYRCGPVRAFSLAPFTAEQGWTGYDRVQLQS